MASGRRVGQRPDCHTFLCKFWHFQMALSQWKLAWLTPNSGILWISVSSFRLCESIVANPIIYKLVPRPSRFETRQWSAPCNFGTSLFQPQSNLPESPRWGHILKEAKHILSLLPPGDRSLIKSAYMPLLFAYLSRVWGGGGFNWPVHNVPVKSKLQHPPRAYPGHLTSFPAREGGNLILGIWT